MDAGGWLSLQRGLWEAVDDGDVGRVRGMLQRGADPTSANQMKVTALHRAARLTPGDLAVEVLTLLLQEGAAPDPPDISLTTPLHHAAAASLAATLHLLSHSHPPNPQTTSRSTPLHYAALSPSVAEPDRRAIIAALLQHGADPSIRDADGMTYDQLLK